MAITKIMDDNGVEISAAQDGAMYNAFAGNSDFIISGIGDEMEFSSNATSLTGVLGSGECIICGRHVTVDQSGEEITITANSEGYIVLRFDTSQTGSNVCRLKQITTSDLRSDNINNTSGVHDLLIGSFVSGAAGVTAFTDLRVVRSSAVLGQLAAARTISLTGDVTGSGSFDGSQDISIATSSTKVLSGTTEPTANQGKDGDIYIMYSE